MRRMLYPARDEWSRLCLRPQAQEAEMRPRVQAILERVKREGDRALFDLSRRFDRVNLEKLSLPVPERVAMAAPLREAIDRARANIEKFHRAQRREERTVETEAGVSCWRRAVAIERVGLYIPGGSAPLFSTLLMLAVPARLAGCGEVVLCTPPGANGAVDEAILYTARLLGFEKIYTVGGAQAIAAMSYGTESVPRVDKIFGPGNQYVTLAKQMVQTEGVAIDMPAGPSELLVISDAGGNPAYIAADLLSQAEHGADSQVVFVTTAPELLDAVEREIERQRPRLPREGIARRALENSMMVLLKDLDEALDFSNRYAPEHLILATEQAAKRVDAVINAGSVFLGPFSCESAGDYASGTNHTLPTNGYARAYSGVSLDSFVKWITYQKISAGGMKNIGPAIETMAAAEQLDAHKNAVTIRLKDIENV
ncbi:MAG TPA: histidinol dehydrogenase [Caldithrix abyssi]|uniref:Histidinol dehydrogenase n=1 Tax=Caldithrix abyssi TaxID=187145 RepID=A0A7V1PTW5_CALAY|nr:histidinol dehydrogenase [Caldithrix abyssi]